MTFQRASFPLTAAFPPPPKAGRGFRRMFSISDAMTCRVGTRSSGTRRSLRTGGGLFGPISEPTGSFLTGGCGVGGRVERSRPDPLRRAGPGDHLGRLSNAGCWRRCAGLNGVHRCLTSLRGRARDHVRPRDATGFLRSPARRITRNLSFGSQLGRSRPFCQQYSRFNK